MKENLIPNKEQLYKGWEVKCPVKGGGHLEHLRGLLRLELRQVPFDELEGLEDDELEDDELEDDEIEDDEIEVECEGYGDEDWVPDLKKCSKYGRGCKACKELICNDPRLNPVDYADTLAEVLDVRLDDKLLGEDGATPAIARFVNQVCWANGL